MKEQRIDIIHTNSSVMNTGGILSYMTGVPHVWHIREFGQEDFNFFPVWKYDRLCRFVESHSNKVVVISQAIGNKFQDIIPSDKLKVIYNGVGEENMYHKTDTKNGEDVVQFLIGGRISPEKGQCEAIRAVALLVKKGYRKLKLFIAGPGDAGGVKEIIAEEGIADYVSILGMVKDMPVLRQRMDVELVCSSCEGFGRVTAEAMMSSNPVIGADTGATPELIRDGENGYLYHKGDVEDLAQKIQIFLDHPEQIRTLGNNGFVWSTEMFTQKRNAEEIEGVYSAVLAGRDKM